MEIIHGEFLSTADRHDDQVSSTYASEGEEKQLKPSVRKALLRFRCKLQDAILANYLLRPQPRSNSGGSSSSSDSSSGRSAHSIRKGKAKEEEDDDYGNEREEEDEERGVNKDISLWGIPLLPSRGHQATDTILLKFLKARNYKVSEAFEMLQKTLKWREEFKVEGILDEQFERDLEKVAYMDSADKEDHPLCYMLYGAFKNEELYKKTFGEGENYKCDRFLRWRIQFMEKGIQKLDLKGGGVNSIIQITDLKNSPGPKSKPLHTVASKAITLLQNNYPEFIFRDILVNVPFWYFAYHKLLSPILTRRAKRKFILVRPSQVAKTLLKFISPENLPVQYGGLKREDDEEFSAADGVSELIVKAGAIESIQIPVTEGGVRAVWDVTVVGWDVNYKEEFIPDDECSYRILIQKEKKGTTGIRNSFYINEPGMILVTIDNATFKKKRVLYRTKIKSIVPMYVLLN